MKPSRCPNLNHRRTTALVRYCHECGERVNANMAGKNGTQEAHAVARRNRNQF